jgi:hypothetical protein
VDLTIAREVTEFLSEFTGTMLFAFFGGLTGLGTSGGAWAALGNGVALATLVYCTAAVSGGKLVCFARVDIINVFTDMHVFRTPSSASRSSLSTRSLSASRS